jgi:predicted nucleic acid-binding protein
VTVAVDTSVAVPLLVRSHIDHAAVARWWNGQEVALSGHALAETYSVLTRLPGDARLAPADAARLLEARFSALCRSRVPAGHTHPSGCKLSRPQGCGS